MAHKGSSGIQVKLFLPLLVLLLPILIIQAYFHYNHFVTRRAEELQANLELARAVGMAFNGMVQDVLRQEFAIAAAITASPSPFPHLLYVLLYQSAQSYSSVRAISWVGPEGRVLESSDPMLVGFDISDRQYFKEIVAGREWVVSDLILSKTTGEPAFTICRSAKDQKGKLVGVVVAAIDASGLEEVFAIERAKDSGISLVDRKGMVVATYPAKKFTWEQRNWLEIYPQKLDEALKGKDTTSVVVSAVNGKKRLVGAVPISSIGWVAAASRSEHDVMSGITSRIVAEASLFLLVTLSAFMTALVLSRPISTSIIRLRDQVLALGRGERQNLPVAPGSTRELIELAQSFSRMAEEVRSREEALSASEKRYRHLVKYAPTGLYEIDFVSRRIKNVNDVMCQVLGYTEEELLGMDPSGLLDEEGQKRFAERVRQSVTGEKMDENLEYRIITKDGRKLCAELNVSFRYEQGRITGALVVAHDVTQRKKTEEILRNNEARLSEVNQIMSGILENTHMQAVLLDSRFNFVWVNRAYADACRHDPSFFPGKNHFDLYPHAENQSVFQRVVDTGKPFFASAKPFQYPDQPKRGVTYWDWGLIPV